MTFYFLCTLNKKGGETMSVMLLRTIFMYFFILFVFRLMGKREIGQLSVFDVVITMMIAELAAISIENPKSPLIQTVAVIGLLALVQIILSYLSLKSERARKLLDGKPSVIIHKGEIDEVVMRKQRYNFDDLLMQLREKDIYNVKDVEFAILESSGKLSVFKKKPNTEKRAPEKRNAQLALPIILDGEIQHDHLKLIQKTPFWLYQQLRKMGYRKIKDISYCSVDDKNRFFIDTYDS